MGRALETTVRRQAGVSIVDLHGEVNAAAEDGLNAAYAEAESQPSDIILLNFGDVEYINSTGIALIVGLLARARKSHRQLLACGLSPHYVEIFKITRLADFLSVFDDEDAALASQSPRAQPRAAGDPGA
jgi:anti-sigma B factor antagonist